MTHTVTRRIWAKLEAIHKILRADSFAYVAVTADEICCTWPSDDSPMATKNHILIDAYLGEIQKKLRLMLAVNPDAQRWREKLVRDGAIDE